jgi:hypothetical protein
MIGFKRILPTKNILVVQAGDLDADQGARWKNKKSNQLERVRAARRAIE